MISPYPQTRSINDLLVPDGAEKNQIPKTCHVTTGSTDGIRATKLLESQQVPSEAKEDRAANLYALTLASTLKLAEFSLDRCTSFSNAAVNFIFTRASATTASLAIRPTCHVTTTSITKICIASKAFLDIFVITAYITQNSVEEFNGFQDRRQ
ncbi:hypothetical protein ACN8ZM_37320 [Burkholderia aenigmatica]